MMLTISRTPTYGILVRDGLCLVSWLIATVAVWYAL